MASTSVVFDIIGRDRASGAFDKVGNAADRSSGKMSKVGGVFGKVAKGAALGFAAVGTGAVVAGKYAFEYGAKLEQMAQKAETVFGGQLGSVEAWADKSAHAMGLTTREATGLAANFADLLIPMGFTRKEAAKMSTDVVGLSGALSQWSGGTKSAAEVTDILNAAMLGETDGLKALGISISAAEVDARLLKNGQDKLTGAAKQQAEAQAIQALIMEKSTDAQKAFAKGGSPLLSAQAKLKATFGEVRDELIVRLVPAMVKLSDWVVNVALPKMKMFGAYLQTVLPPIFERVRAVIAKFTGDGSGKFSKFINDTVQIFKDGIAIAKDLWRLFGDNILQYLKSTFENIKSVLSGAFDIIRGIFKTVSALLKGDWGKAWDGIKLILRGAAKVIRGLVGQLFNVLRFAFKNAGVALKKIWSVAWDGIKQLAGKGKDWLVDKIKSIPGFIKGLAGRYVEAGRWIMSKLWDVIKDKARDGHQFLVDKIREIPGKIKDLGGKFLEAGGSLVRKIFEGIRNAASGAGGLLGDVAGSFAESFKGVINNLVDRLNDLIPNEIEINNAPNINLPDNPIPHLARGTNNWRGGWAMVGEEGPELVNLPGGSRVLPHGRSVGALRASGGGNVTINISGALDPVAVGRQVEQVLIKYTAATGRPLQVSTR